MSRKSKRSHRGSGGNSHQRAIQKAAKTRAQEKKHAVIEESSIAIVTPIPTPTGPILYRLLDWIEQPLFLLSAGIVGGLMAFILPALFAVCAICVVLAFHRAKVVEGQPIRKQMAAYAALILIITVLFTWAGREVSRHSIADEIASKVVAAQNHVSQQPTPIAPTVQKFLFTQEQASSTHDDAPFAIRVVIQTTASVQPTSLAITCSSEVAYADYRIGGLENPQKSGDRFVDKGKSIFWVFWGTPAFKPEDPFVITLMSRTENRILSVQNGPPFPF